MSANAHTKAQRQQFIQNCINAIQRAPEGTVFILAARDIETNNTLIHAHVESPDFDGSTLATLDYAKATILSDPGRDNLEEGDGGDDWPDDDEDDEESDDDSEDDGADRTPKH